MLEWRSAAQAVAAKEALIDRRTIGTLILVLALFGSTSGCAGTERSDPGFEGNLKLARQQMAGGQLDTARRLLVDARIMAETDEERCLLAIQLGDCLFELKQFAAASDEYYRARGFSEDQDRELTYLASMGLARSRAAESQWPTAERHYLEAVSLSDRSEQRDRAFLALARGNFERGDSRSASDYMARISDQNLLGLSELRGKLESRPKPQPRSTVAKAPAEELKLPSVLAPEIIARARWGARAIKSSGNPEPMEKPWRITIHHSAEPEIGPTDFGQAAAQMRSFQTFHQGDKGWADIGYHYVIDGAGRVWEGRDINIQGAHAGTRELNRGNIGVCLMGDFSKLEPTADQKKSLRRLLSWLCESRSIHPRFIVGHRAGMNGVSGKGTLCPGLRLEAYLVRLIPFLPRP